MLNRYSISRSPGNHASAIVKAAGREMNIHRFFLFSQNRARVPDGRGDERQKLLAPVHPVSARLEQSTDTANSEAAFTNGAIFG